MTHMRTLPERVALMLLARDGIAAIWQLNLQAAEAYRTGHPCAAVSILEIADAAEQAWLRAEGARIFT
jgi:mono/diheme cytochrome c family protein